MCGFAGFWQGVPASAEDLEARVLGMTKAIVNRGPDDLGIRIEPADGLALGFRRLAILDLSPEGHQPMDSGPGRYTITFNGEIYNYLELRQTLEASGIAFRGHSDTEVLLAAFECWGLETTLKRLNGMFAMAVWDRRNHALHLARDPLGIKPLYVGRHGRTWLWGSELKALREHPDFLPAMNTDAMTLFLRHGYVPGPASIIRGIRKLQPGHLLTLAHSDGEPECHPFWSLAEVRARAIAEPFRGTEEEAVDAVEAALRRSVGMQMMSDVPLGAFLSGGIDSSLVAAFMQAQSPRPVKTFCIGFQEDAFNEAGFARKVAAHLGTDHTDWIISPREALELIPHLPEIYDEPFADPAGIPTCLVSRLARTQVTVSLSGDGGDELFGGYNFHVSAQTGRLAQTLRWPAPLRQGLGAGMAALAGLLDRVPGTFAGHASAALAFRSRPFRFRNPMDYYRTQVADELDQGRTVLRDRSRNPVYLLSQDLQPPGPENLAEMFMYLDMLMMLPDEFLTKIDRATMSVSLEGRVPLLDVDLVALAWRLPIGLKIRGGSGKWILRQVLKRHLPVALVDRPKHGFSVPLGSWLRGPLKDWAAALLDPRRIQDQGWLSGPAVAKYWGDHLSERADHLPILWRLIMFQSWLDQAGLA